MIETQKILDRLDGLGFLKSLFPGSSFPDHTSGEVAILCPFHADKSPSCHFNVQTKQYHCKGCGAGGSAVDLLARVAGISRPQAVAELASTLGVFDDKAIAAHVVEEFHAALLVNAQALQALQVRKGLDAQDVATWRLGWDAEAKRLVIPVRDEHGAVVNLRKYDLLKLNDPKHKYLNLKGHAEVRLWPLDALAEPHAEVVLTEGELKMISLRRRGFNAVTPTGGAAVWKDQFTPRFKQQRVVLCYDVDATGVARALQLARRLATVADEVKVVRLPLDVGKHPHGGVEDYFAADGYTAQDFRNLITSTPVWQPDATPAREVDEREYDVDLGSASKAQYFDRRVVTPVLVSAKDTAPYIVPAKLHVNCPRGMEICAVCPVNLAMESPDGKFEVVWRADDPELLDLIEVDKPKQARRIADLIGIPGGPNGCRVHELVVAESHNLEEVRLEPQIERHGDAPSGAEQAVARAYVVGHGTQANSTYRMKARATVDPRDQHATLLVYEAVPHVDNLSTFAPTEPDLQALVLFQPSAWTVDGIETKLNELYADLESNVTRIFQRRDMHAMFDLVWHSALYVTLDGEPRKGWVDALVLGDSGQGKSETAQRLLRHYGLGEWVDMKGATEAGLKGGLQEQAKRWWVSWGAVPKADRRGLVLDEAKGATTQALQSLTSMRSSGIAELVKIERRRAYARTRLLWVTNPRPARSVETYSYGVLAIKELFGSLEDVRRLDAAMIVASNEVPTGLINAALRDVTPRAAHVHTAELCRRLILWAWSRTAAQVNLEPDAYETCLDMAAAHAKKYSAEIPLVEPADHRMKLARLAAAMAARTFSCTDDGYGVIVRKCHVEWVGKFLDRCYSSRFMGYLDYSRDTLEADKLVNPDEVKRVILGATDPSAVMAGLTRSTAIRQSDLSDWFNVDFHSASGKLSTFVRANALVRRGTDYYKTVPFIDWLRKLVAQDKTDYPSGRPVRERGSMTKEEY